jgi:hypothetical protein
MTSKHLSGILVTVLIFGLSLPAAAQNSSANIAPSGKRPAIVSGPIGPTPSTGEVVGVIAGVVAAVVVVTILTVHYSKKRSVTGCVSSGATGLTLTEESSNRTYLLSGNTVGLKLGDKMKLHGRKTKSNGPDKTLVWDTEKVSKDYGVCKVGGSS